MPNTEAAEHWPEWALASFPGWPWAELRMAI
jgi:hypothetical protein